MENFIQIKKSNKFVVGIKDENGVDTGNTIEFDLEDIDLPFKLNDCAKQHDENLKELKRKFAVIEKKKDTKTKNQILSYNTEAKIKAIKEFYLKEEKALDLFLGENGTKKILNGRKPYYTMFDDISEMLEPILPKLTENAHTIEDRIKSKYTLKNEEDNII